MIELFDVSKYYPTPNGRHYVLKNASVVIPDGAQVGVLGPNGAGKSTLMRLLAGVDMPNEGTIKRTGSISWPMGLASSMQGSLTGRENARFACRLQGVRRVEMEDMVEGVKAFSEIGDYFEMPVRTYSSGMRARLNFAIAMAFTFDCYIIDELTAVGDKNFRIKSAQVFKEKRKTASFIKVSHSLSELRSECNMGLVLNKGSVKLYDSIEEAIEIYEENIAPSTDDNSGAKATQQRPNQNRGKGPMSGPNRNGAGGRFHGPHQPAGKNMGQGPRRGPGAGAVKGGLQGPNRGVVRGPGQGPRRGPGAGAGAGGAQGPKRGMANGQGQGPNRAQPKGPGNGPGNGGGAGPKRGPNQGGLGNGAFQAGQNRAAAGQNTRHPNGQGKNIKAQGANLGRKNPVGGDNDAK